MSTNTPSQLDLEQETPPLRRLFLARQGLYDVAKRWQLTQLLFIVCLPILGAIWGVLFPLHRPAISAMAVLLTLLDVLLLDRQYRKSLKRAAKGAELFDTTLFKLPWNALSAGPQLSVEEIERHYRARDATKLDPEKIGWYPAGVGRAPLHIARVICQRANVSYDSALRRHYAALLLGVVFIVAAAIFLTGLLSSATLSDVVLTALVPPAPLLIWALREYFRQIDAADANETVQRESEALLNRVIADQCDEPNCSAQSVQLQSALFARRAANPLLFPGVYKFRRPRLEGEMDAGADHWLQKAGF